MNNLLLILQGCYLCFRCQPLEIQVHEYVFEVLKFVESDHFSSYMRHRDSGMRTTMCEQYTPSDWFKWLMRMKSGTGLACNLNALHSHPSVLSLQQ